MKKLLFLTLVFTSISFCLSVFEVRAQMAYGVSFVRANIHTRIVDGHSSTSLDYYTGFFYDPEVFGDLYSPDSPETSLDSGSDTGFSSVLPAEVFLITTNFVEGSFYCTFSQHYLRPSFFFPLTGDGFDPFQFDALDNETGGPWEGSSMNQDEVAPRRIYLGWTQACVRAPTMSTPTPTPPPPTPTPTPCVDDLGEACQPRRLFIAVSPEQLRPSGVTGGGKKAGVGVCVYNPITLERIPDVEITLKLIRNAAVTNSGGHIDSEHFGRRPLGRLEKTRGATNSNGCFTTQYVPTHISGIVAIQASGVGSTDTAYLGILVPGFDQLPIGENYVRIGSTSEHPSNHWGTFLTIENLINIADEYKNIYYGRNEIPENDKLRYNDISLFWGGKFDLASEWSPRGSHGEHREGINVDVRCCRTPGNVPRSRWVQLNRIFYNFGSTQTHDETNTSSPHWHLRFVNFRIVSDSAENSNGIEQNTTNLGEVNSVPVTINYFVEYALWTIYDQEATQEQWSNWYNRLTDAKALGNEQFLLEAKAFERELFSLSAYAARNRTDEEFVSDVFSAYLMREPTSEETSFWTSYLENLPPSLPKNRKRARLLTEFESNSEFEDTILSIIDEEDGPVPLPTP
jgi:hypothetical protein